MAMTVIITRDVEERYRGFILSCMPEIAPGVYASSNLNQGIRERLWAVVWDWHAQIGRGSISMIHEDRTSPSGLHIRSVGEPAKELIDFDGFYVSLKRE
ncbi:putative ssRNA endonuclease [compost metagenome]